MPDIVTFTDKVDNAEASTAAASIPETQKLPASHINQLKSGVNANHNDIVAIEAKTDFITVTQAVDLDVLDYYNRNAEQNITASANINSPTKTALINASSEVTATLPLASTVPIGGDITIKRLGTGNVIIARSGSDTIDSTAINYDFDGDSAIQFSARTFRSNGTNGWYII